MTAASRVLGIEDEFPGVAEYDARAQKQLYAALLHENLALFAKDVLGLEIGPHVLTWSDLVSEYNRIGINAARDHGKSAFFSYAYPIWRAWREPGCEVYLFSNTLEQAQEFLDIILYGRNNLKGMVATPLLESLVPGRVIDIRSTREERLNLRRPRDQRVRLNRSDVRLTNGSRIRVAGFGKAMRGRHPKYVVLDDPINDEDMWSETVRRKNIEYFKSAITNMVPHDGQLIVVGTPFSATDLYGYLRKNRSYVFAKFPGILRDASSGKEHALFPYRWTLSQLKLRLKEIGSVAFAREILCEPISDDISVFPAHLFPPCFDNTITLRMTKEQIRAHKLSVYFGVDIARSASVGADYFVIFVIGRDTKGNQYVIDIRRTKGLAFRQQLHEIEIAAELYDPTLILIESNAMQQLYSSELRRETDLPVKEFVTLATNKYPLDRGVPGQRLLLENRKLIIPRGDEYSVTITDMWMQECHQFGYIDGKLQGVGAHDDTVMAWWIATEASRLGGFGFAFDEGEAGDDDEGGGDENWESVMLGDDGESQQDAPLF